MRNWLRLNQTKPTWGQIGFVLILTCLLAIGLGALGGALLGGFWGGKIAQVVTTGGGLIGALLLIRRRAAIQAERANRPDSKSS